MDSSKQDVSYFLDYSRNYTGPGRCRECIYRGIGEGAQDDRFRAQCLYLALLCRLHHLRTTGLSILEEGHPKHTVGDCPDLLGHVHNTVSRVHGESFGHADCVLVYAPLIRGSKLQGLESSSGPERHSYKLAPYI